MIRVIGLILVFGVMLVFTLINNDVANRCDIKYWFTAGAVLPQVPVVLTIFISFAVGMLCAFPVMFFIRLGKKKKAELKAAAKTAELESDDGVSGGSIPNGKQ
jgi:uncharacterized integral membrane protein